MNIHEHMAEKMELAGIYAQDGAFRTAAKILQDLGARLVKHADDCDRLLGEIQRKDK